MEIIQVENAFGASVHHSTVVASTMDEARSLAASGVPHGTVVVADVQEAGRGRTAGRVWADEAGKSLLCTTILRFANLASMPAALTLRVGLAAARAVEDVTPALRGRVLVKWPNDLMIAPAAPAPATVGARKVCGILCESDGKTVFVGVGINVGQTRFPEDLAAKATSIALDAQVWPDRFALLARLLFRLKEALSPASDATWREDLSSRLHLRGERVRFMAGSADSPTHVEGVLVGIGASGELLILCDGETEPRPFVAGELLAYAV